MCFLLFLVNYLLIIGHTSSHSPLYGPPQPPVYQQNLPAVPVMQVVQPFDRNYSNLYLYLLIYMIILRVIINIVVKQTIYRQMHICAIYGQKAIIST